MFQVDPLGLVPQSIKDAVLDTTVDFLSGQAKKLLGDEIASKIKKLRTDASFHQSFEKGLKRALERFKLEYEEQDEDIVAAITADPSIFKDEKFQATLLEMIKRPGTYLDDEREKIVSSFESILQGRKNRQRVNRALSYLLRCIVEEVWHLPELQPIYSLQFQRMTAEATRQQVEIQKAQLQALTELNTGVRQSLLQLTEAIAKNRLLPDGNSIEIPQKSKVIHNLPNPDYGQFVGRDKELGQLLRVLRPYPHSQHSVITIDGIGGIGKSALALEAAYRYLRNFDQIPVEERYDAIIWVSAKKNSLSNDGVIPCISPSSTLHDIYRTLSVVLDWEAIIRAKPEDQFEVVKSVLAQYRTLLILDNFETIDDEAIVSFIREIPAPTKVIITTRHRIDVAYTIRLHGMIWEEAASLIKTEINKKKISLNKEQSHCLFEYTGGIPLAIVWSIAQIGRGFSIDVVLQKLTTPSNDITKYCFENQLEIIKNKPSHTLLRLLAFFTPDANRETLGEIASMADLIRDEGLVELEDLSLINRFNGRYSMLQLVKNYLLNSLSDCPEIKGPLENSFVDYFQKYCEQYGGEKWHLYSYLDIEIQNIQTAIQIAYQHELWPSLSDLVYYIMEYLDRRVMWKELVDYSRLALDAAMVMGDKSRVARYKVFGLGWIQATRFGLFEEGLESIREGKAIALSVGDKRRYAMALRDEGVVLRRMNQLNEAKKYVAESLTLFRELGDTRWEIRTIGSLGRIDQELGNHQIAHDLYQTALSMANDVGDSESIALNSRRLSWIARLDGDFQKARDLALVAVDLFLSLKVFPDATGSLIYLAEAEFTLGELEQADSHLMKAKELAKRFGLKREMQRADDLEKKMQGD